MEVNENSPKKEVNKTAASKKKTKKEPGIHDKGLEKKPKIPSGFGKILPKDVSFSIGGVIDTAKDGGTKVIQRVVDMKRRSTNPLMDEIEDKASETSRSASKFVAEAPGKIEMAAKNGISSIIGGISDRAKNLAIKVSPNVKKKAQENPTNNKDSNSEQLLQ